MVSGSGVLDNQIFLLLQLVNCHDSLIMKLVSQSLAVDPSSGSSWL